MSAASSMRLTLFPFLKKVPYTIITPIFENTKWGYFRYCSFPPSPQPHSWQPFRKKKVVMRLAYVGTNYRGLQIQPDQHSLSSMLLYLLFLITYYYASLSYSTTKIQKCLV